jgi:uncharacterized protein (UPF0333 family)
MKISKAVKVFLLTGVMAVGTGCSYASKSDLDQVRADVADAKRMSEQALNTSNEARQTAQNANNRSDKIEEAMTRNFKKSMYK